MEKGEQVTTVCVKCKKDIPGTKEADGSVRAKCPYCGMIVISQRLSRRHMRLEVFAPNNQKGA